MERANRDQLDEVVEEFVQSMRSGGCADPAALCKQYPELANELAGLLPIVLALEQARGSASNDEISGTRLGECDAMPAQIGDYRIVREIGRGGMGIVYEAEQESLHRRVALKVLPGWSIRTPRQVRRFEREAQAVARLHHTNIVPIFGVGEGGGLRYLVMQLISGRALDRVIEELREARSSAGPWSTNEQPTQEVADLVQTFLLSRVNHWRAVARIGVQAADALEYAARQGIVHRDIKPSNLLLDAAGTVWVTDFGLAKSEDSGDITVTDEILGTLRYLPPERLRGISDARGDVYSLGATLYELLVLRPPFEDSQQAVLLRQIVDTEPAHPRNIDPSIPRDLETILLKAMAKEPASRYVGPGELADDLRCVLQDRPIKARRVSSMERLWRWCRRHPTVALPTLAATILSLAIAIGATVAASRLKQSGDLAREAGRRAVDAERAGRIELYRAHLATAKISPLTGRPGQRLDGLRAVQAAVAALPPGEFTDERRSSLINAAIQCLAYPDARPVRRVPLPHPLARGRIVDLDASLSRYVCNLSEDRGSRIANLDGSNAREFPGPQGETPSFLNWRQFSESGTWLGELLYCSPDDDRQRIRIWQLDTNRAALDFVAEARGMRLAFHPDDKHAIVSGDDAVLRLYDLTTGELKRESPARFRRARVSYKRDGKLLMICGDTCRPELIDPETWETVESFSHLGVALQVQWNPTQDYLVMLLPNHKLYLWDHNWRRGRYITDCLTGARDLRFSPDGRLLACWSDSTTQVRRMDGEQVLVTIPGSGIRFSSDGRTLAALQKDELVLIELLERQACTSILNPVESAEFSPDGRYLALGGRSGQQIYCSDRLTLAATLELDHCGPAAFSTSGEEMVSFGIFSLAWKWPLGRCVGDPVGPPIPLMGRQGVDPDADGPLYPQHDGRHAAYDPVRRSFVLADYRNGRVLLSEPGKPAAIEFARMPHVTRVAVSPNGQFIVGESRLARRVRVWDAAKASIVLDLPGYSAAALSADGEYFAARSAKSVDLYRLPSWTIARTIELDQPQTEDRVPLAFQPQGKLLAVAASAGNVHLYDRDTAALIANLPHRDRDFASWLSFSPDGARLAVTHGSVDVQVWSLSVVDEELAALGLNSPTPLLTQHCNSRSATTPAPLKFPSVDRGELPSPNLWQRFWRRLAVHEADEQRWFDANHAVSMGLVIAASTDSKAQADLLTLRGEYRYRMLDAEAALADWHQAIALDAKAIVATRWVARLCGLGPPGVADHRRVGVLATSLLQVDSRDPCGSALLGLAHARHGDAATALENFARAESSPEWRVIAAYGTALARKRAGQSQQAAEALATAERLQGELPATLPQADRSEMARLRAEVEAALADNSR